MENIGVFHQVYYLPKYSKFVIKGKDGWITIPSPVNEQVTKKTTHFS